MFAFEEGGIGADDFRSSGSRESRVIGKAARQVRKRGGELKAITNRKPCARVVPRFKGCAIVDVSTVCCWLKEFVFRVAPKIAGHEIELTITVEIPRRQRSPAAGHFISADS